MHRDGHAPSVRPSFLPSVVVLTRSVVQSSPPPPLLVPSFALSHSHSARGLLRPSEQRGQVSLLVRDDACVLARDAIACPTCCRFGRLTTI